MQTTIFGHKISVYVKSGEFPICYYKVGRVWGTERWFYCLRWKVELVIDWPQP